MKANELTDENGKPLTYWGGLADEQIKRNTMLTISDEVLFEQATVAMEEMYGSGCETEIDAYFRGLKWMQKQFNK